MVVFDDLGFKSDLSRGGSMLTSLGLETNRLTSIFSCSSKMTNKGDSFDNLVQDFDISRDGIRLWELIVVDVGGTGGMKCP